MIEARLSLLLQFAILVVLVVVAVRLSNLDFPAPDNSGVESKLDAVSSQLDAMSGDLNTGGPRTGLMQVLLAICATEQNGGHIVASLPASYQCSLGK